MTALVGLATRLALAEIALLVPSRLADVDVLAPVIDAGVDLLILEGSDDVDSDVEMLRAIRARWGTTTLLTGTGNKKVAEPALADVVHLARPGWRFWGYPKGHQWSLLGRHAGEAGIVEAPGEDFDYLFVGPLVAPQDDLLALAVEHQPPLAPGALPWFALGDFTVQEVDACLSVGARRIALTGAVLEREDPAAEIGVIAEAVARSWAGDELAHDYRAAALRL